MQLSELVATYLLENECCEKYADSLTSVERSFSAFLSRPAATDDLTDDTVNRWLTSLNGSLAPSTKAGKRRQLLTLWRDAFDRRVIDRLPGRVRTIKQPEIVPECWTLEQFRLIEAACDALPGTFRRLKVSRSLYMRALVDAKYDTAL